MREVKLSAHDDWTPSRVADQAGDGEPSFDAERVADHRAGELDPETARPPLRLGIDVARQLGQAVPEGWRVSTRCLWPPERNGDLLLRPDVAVHRPFQPDGSLPTPPILCVGIAPARLDLRSVWTYARHGVDHYWHLDSRDNVLEILVRVDDDYRHAETLVITNPDLDPAAGAVEWVDFGIGVVRLTLGASADIDADHDGLRAGA